MKTSKLTVASFSVVHIAIPPKNTTKNVLAKADYFGNFEKAILKYIKKGNINFREFKCQNWVPRSIPT